MASGAMTMANEQPAVSGDAIVGTWIKQWVPVLIACAVACTSSLGAYFTLGTEVTTLKEWRQAHEAYHRDKSADLALQEGRTSARLQTIETELRKVDELSFRIGAAEQATSGTAAALRELQTTVASQASDIRLVLEILNRMEQRRADLGTSNGNLRKPER